MHRSTRRRVGQILLLGFVGAALIAGASVALQATAENDGRSAGDDTVPPFTVPAGEAAPVPSERITVTASSSLPPDGAITYTASNMIDGDLLTAWNSDAPGSDGRGQVLVFRFTEPVDLRSIELVNGYAKDDDIYASNHRIKEVRITADSGTREATLHDTSRLQAITHDFGLTSKVVLEVLDVFPGAGFDNPDLTADLALTEVDFTAVQP